jgi:PIN domain nuclease of toxin-antitoxin system
VHTSPANRILVSTASAWELCLEHHQGKPPELDKAIAELPALLKTDGFEILPISLVHTLRAGGYNQPHRDPFDRMLAAQAELDDLVLLRADRMLASVPCKILW